MFFSLDWPYKAPLERILKRRDEDTVVTQHVKMLEVQVKSSATKYKTGLLV